MLEVGIDDIMYVYISQLMYTTNTIAIWVDYIMFCNIQYIN